VRRGGLQVHPAYFVGIDLQKQVCRERAYIFNKTSRSALLSLGKAIISSPHTKAVYEGRNLYVLALFKFGYDGLGKIGCIVLLYAILSPQDFEPHIKTFPIIKLTRICQNFRAYLIVKIAYRVELHVAPSWVFFQIGGVDFALPPLSNPYKTSAGFCSFYSHR
jgi:hypothetical protein